MMSTMRLAAVIAVALSRAAAQTCAATEGGGAETPSSCSNEDKEYNALVEWVVSKGGYYNPKQEFRRADPADPNSYMGMFATARIEKGEKLVSVPWDTIISDPADAPTLGDTAMACGTIFKYVEEMRKFRAGEETRYKPFLSFLESRPPVNPWPSGYTKAGAALLGELLGDELLPPYDAFSWYEEWEEVCHGSLTNATEHEGVMALLIRGEDNRIIPLYDMYNHRNGKKYFNTDTEVEEFGHQSMTATRAIEPGEQIYGSYNLCNNCGDYRRRHYGAPDILRDYGFVEQYPQRWIFPNERVGFDLDQSEDGSSLEISWLRGYGVKKKELAKLKKQGDRLVKDILPKLEQARKDLEEAGGTAEDLPTKAELDTIWAYYTGMTTAINTVAGEGCPNGLERHGECLMVRYDDLDEESEFDYSRDYVCDITDTFDYVGYKSKKATSAYQNLNWYVRPTDNDVCMELDNIMQICSAYRPHYHEFMTHLPARFRNSIRRAAFVGGGDSMLLHELLKYPEIEKVVGLELDQTVVRTSFKYFRSQPHFDDDRVEWWFGDATKSMLMLPKEYFGSFDLILVDLSETFASESVTEHFNIKEILALLLKPDGIFVKNEFYFAETSEIFDYTIQTYHRDVPKICNQNYAMGSNRIDFINPIMENLKKHNVEMLLLEPIKNDEDRFAHIHNYQRNYAREQGKCGKVDMSLDEFDLHAGIVMVLEAENTTIPHLSWEAIAPSIQSALTKEGLTPLSTVSQEGGSVGVTVMREGVVTARLWPAEKYCAFDIHLWGGFSKMDSVRNALAQVVGSDKSSLSSYRVIVSGMQGASTWDEDNETNGPVISHNRNCDENPFSVEAGAAVATSGSEELAAITLEESMKLIHTEDPVIVVVCGEKVDESDCSSLKLLDNHPGKVVPLWTCPGLDDSSSTQNPTARTFNCEEKSFRELRNIASEQGKISYMIIDPSAPKPMLQLLTRMMKREANRDRFLMERVNFIGLMPDKTETWRRNFLERILVDMETHSAFRAEVLVKGSGGGLELGIVSSGDPKFVAHVKDMSGVIASRANVDAEVHKIQGGDFIYQEDNWNPRAFPTSDYDQTPGIEQYNKQQPLAHQIILRLNIKDLDASAVTKALADSLVDIAFTKMKTRIVSDKVGDGSVFVALAAEGNVVATLDGQDALDVNFFSYEPRFAESFVNDLTKKKLPNAKVVSRDDQPRGIGRVVNLIKDYGDDNLMAHLFYPSNVASAE